MCGGECPHKWFGLSSCRVVKITLANFTNMCVRWSTTLRQTGVKKAMPAMPIDRCLHGLNEHIGHPNCQWLDVFKERPGIVRRFDSFSPIELYVPVSILGLTNEQTALGAATQRYTHLKAVLCIRIVTQNDGRCRHSRSRIRSGYGPYVW